MEAIELYRTYQSELAEIKAEEKSTGKSLPTPPLPPLMAAYQPSCAEDYMAKMIESVKSSELEQTLLVFPFDVTVHLIEIMETLLEQNRSAETVCRMFFFIVEVNFGPLSSARDMHPLLGRVKGLAEKRLRELRDTIGFNVAAVEYHRARQEESERAYDLVEAVHKHKEKRRRKRNKEKAMQAAVLAL